MNNLPAPSADELALSAELASLIHREIAAASGSIPFSRFMELCLYAPGLGYYSAGHRKFGPGGDFVTAPEVSPLFGRCLARSCGEVLQSLGGGDILEFGAAADNWLLTCWANWSPWIVCLNAIWCWSAVPSLRRDNNKP